MARALDVRQQCRPVAAARRDPVDDQAVLMQRDVGRKAVPAEQRQLLDEWRRKEMKRGGGVVPRGGIEPPTP